MPDHLVIDVDGHVFEPDGLWEQYLPARFHEQRPRLITDERGTTRYVIEGKTIPPGTGTGAWAPEGIRESTTLREGGVDAGLRLAEGRLFVSGVTDRTDLHKQAIFEVNPKRLFGWD